MPRQQIVDRVVKDANEKAAVLNNTQYMVNQEQYQPNWNIYPASGDVEAAKRILDAAGWVPGSDGVRQKGNVKLAFTVGTTSGNQARDSVRADHPAAAQKIGVKLTIKNSPDILDVNLPAFDYQTHHLRLGRRPRPVRRQRDLAVVGDPGDVLEAPGQGRGVRLQRAELHQGEGPAGRRAPERHRPGHPTRPCGRPTSTQADEQLATNDVTVVPLFQKPTQLGYRNTIAGVQDNPTQDGFTWNIEDWTFTR